MNRTFRCLLAVLAFGPVPAAHAQRVESPYRFIDASQEGGAFVAYVAADKGAVGLGATSGPAFGARYTIRISGPFMLDVEGMYFPTERAVLDTVVVDSAFRSIGTARQQLVIGTAALRLNLTGNRTWHGFIPFVAFGGGGVLEAGSDDEDFEVTPVDAKAEFGTSFAGSLGAGFQYFPSERLSIRVDGRNLLWKVETPAALRRGNLGATMPADEWLQNLTASVGVSIHF